MASASEPAYFAKARQAGRPVVRDLPKFDLDAYIANYKGAEAPCHRVLMGSKSEQGRLDSRDFYTSGPSQLCWPRRL